MRETVSNVGRPYQHGHEQSTLAAHGTRTAADSAAYLLPHLRPGLSVLDVGCGPGSVTLDLAGVVAPGRVVGIDQVETPLESAREAAAERGDALSEFRTADVMSLPFPDGAFDVVHAHQVLQHLPDPVGALREMARVCVPDGLVAVRDADYAAMAWYPDSPGLTAWLDVYRRVAHARGAEPDAGRRMRAWARTAGLTGARITASTWTYADADGCRWWGESQAARVSGEVFTERAAEVGVGRTQVAEMVRAWRAWAAEPDAWFLIPHGELLWRRPAR